MQKYRLAIDSAIGCSIALAPIHQQAKTHQQFGQYITSYNISKEATSAHATRQILATLDNAITTLQIDKSQICEVYFNHGPGSFIGVRAGYAIACGLHLGINAQLYPLSGLSAYAYMQKTFPCTVAIDARMGQIYLASFDEMAELFAQLTQPFDSSYFDLLDTNNTTNIQRIMVDSQDNCAEKMLYCVEYAQAMNTPIPYFSFADIQLLYIRNNIATAKNHSLI